MVSFDLRAPLRHPEVLAVDQRISLGPQHVAALRLREIHPKEAFTLCDQKGHFFRASLTTLDADRGQALVYESMASSPESPVHLTLLCAVLARQRMLSVIQKATELGVACVLPVITERSVDEAGLAHEKAHAWPAQAVRAARQCRRGSLPEVRAAVPLTVALDDVLFRSAERRLVLDDRAPLRAEAAEPQRPSRIAFVVGPEGGFTDAERALVEGYGATSLRLGGRVLRAETAVLVGLTILQHRFGDL